MIRFKYPIPNQLLDLIHDTIADYTDDFLYGMLDESLAGQLSHCSLYLLCDSMESGGERINRNPVVIVAGNMNDAMEMYGDEFKKEGYVLAELESRCDKIKVEPV